jgi:hypothetical protein
MFSLKAPFTACYTASIHHKHPKRRATRRTLLDFDHPKPIELPYPRRNAHPPHNRSNPTLSIQSITIDRNLSNRSWQVGMVFNKDPVKKQQISRIRGKKSSSFLLQFYCNGLARHGKDGQNAPPHSYFYAWERLCRH